MTKTDMPCPWRTDRSEFQQPPLCMALGTPSICYRPGDCPTRKTWAEMVELLRESITGYHKPGFAKRAAEAFKRAER